MSAVDECNRRFCRGTVVPGKTGVIPARRDWSTKFEIHSPRYKRRVAELQVLARYRTGGVAMSEEVISIFDVYGETALAEARRLTRAGELASRAHPRDDDYEAFGAVFRAIDGHLETIGRWVESGRQEVVALCSARKQEGP